MRFLRFFREETGSIAPLFALSLVPIVALAGASVDLANMRRMHSVLQVAVDSTALAVNHDLHTTTAQSAIQNRAQAFFSKQVAGLDNPLLDPVTFNVAEGRVDVRGSVVYTPQFMNTLGFGPFTLSAKARTVVGDQEIEVALVLDNSGSMSGSRISSLRDAAADLVNTLYEAQSANTRVKVAIVPFSGAVNVGADKKTETWMDTGGLSPAHSENFVEAANRFTLFDEMKDVSWAGCVESRPGDYGVDDTEPTTEEPITLFVPMFAPDEPDEPDEEWYQKDFVNDYLNDGGTNGNCSSADKSDDSDEGRQSRVCKYKDREPDTDSWGSTRKGPNFWCNSKPIVALTNDKQKLLDTISVLPAKGYTNIHEGLMWGWRVLSPGAPFTEGASYSKPNLRKYIILMTDGANTINGRDTHNNSDYSAYGYASNNRLADDAEDMSGWELKDAMDDRLKDACQNAKNADPANPGIISIYTIAFKVDDEDTLELLSDCATTTAMAKTADNDQALKDTFAQIAQELGKLRIVE